MKKTYFLLGLFFLSVVAGSPVLAEETDDELDLLLEDLAIEEDYKYEFPEIPPDIHLHLGYRLADLGGLSQVFEYEHLEDSVTAGAEIRIFEFPHRFFFDADFVTKEDYFGEIRYAYGDYVLFRWLNNSFYHNLENIRLQDYDPLTVNPSADNSLDAGNEYGIQARENKFHLVAKPPRIPLHIYLDGFYLARDGDVQQRNLFGSGYFNNMELVSQRRSIDTTTRIYKMGASSHLGMMELDFAHTEKRFSVDGMPVLEETYAASGYRTAGDYEHSRIPETEGSGNTLRVHSTYTGQWVASATLTQSERENNYSGANSEVKMGSGSVRWNPLTNLSLALRYTHRDLDNQSPAPVAVIQPVSSRTDTIAFTGRYKPAKGLTFRAKYRFQKIDRSNAAAWNLTESTTKNKVYLAADSRLHSRVFLNTGYSYKNISDPAYNTDPEHAHNAFVKLTWLPVERMNILFRYDFTHQERDNLNFSTTDDPWYREADMNDVMLVGVYQITEKFSVRGSYSFMQYEVMQDLAYEDMGATFQVDRNAEIEQEAHVFTFGVDYRLSDALAFLGEATFSKSRGGLYPNADDLLEPLSIGWFSRMEQRYLLLHFGAEYRFSDSLSFDLDYRFGDFEDVLDNIYDDITDDEAHIIMLNTTINW